jgi:hypothetical protein
MTRRVQLQVELTERQSEAKIRLAQPATSALLYGGAKGGGKSWFLCVWCYNYACELIGRFGLKPSEHPPHVGWMGRKQAVEFAGTTLQTWREWIPPETYTIKSGTEKDPKHINIMGCVCIDFGGLDKQENINKFNSAEYGFIAIDQAEETSRDDVSVAQGSLRLKIKGVPLSYKELYTANPRNCWLRDEFIINPLPGNVFVPALPRDNPHLPPDYEQKLVRAFGYRPELLRAYRDGDWSVIEGADQVILDAWLVRARSAIGIYNGTILVCDPARFGDDMTEIMLLNGTEIEQQESMPYSRTTEVSSRLTELSRQNDDCTIVVDDTGVGGGVTDELYERGRHVIPFNGSEKADDPETYYNKRAEAWWECGEDFSQTRIGCWQMSYELRQDLCAPTYSFRNDRILIEKKDSIKERLGRSPGKGDCYVMGIWALKRAAPKVPLPFYVSAALNLSHPTARDNNILTRGFRVGRRKYARV